MYLVPKLECQYNNPNWHADMMARFAELKPLAASLNVLDLSGLGMNWGYHIPGLEEEVAHFLHVEHVDLSVNYIDSILFSFKDFPNLKSVNLACNALYYWGNEGSFRIWEQVDSPTLEHLSLSWCQLGVVDLRNTLFFESLRTLSLSGNGFQDWYPVKSRCPRLRMDPFPRLESLDLQSNHYTGVPKLDYLPALRSLDLSENPIRCNHQALLGLKHLQRLGLRNTGLHSIPAALKEMRGLRELDLRHNPLAQRAVDQLQVHLPGTKILAGDT